MNAKREAMIVTKMRIVQTQLALTTAHVGLEKSALKHVSVVLSSEI